MGLFSKIKKGLQKTKQQMVSKIELLLNSFTKIDEDLFEQLEETLIMSDVGVETSVEICSQLRKKIKEQGIKNPNEIMRLIHEIVAEMMGDDTELDLSEKPAVIMVIGVNGAGKTTTIGKLCYKLKNEGKNVLVAAADTFRAAAIDQLEVWTERAGVNIVKHAEGSDAAAVVYDGLSAAKARGCDVLIVDTAGRLHNKKNLMDELAKINRIINQQAEGCSREILLVLDATTGQNAVNQAKLFKEAADITGIVLTKLDGTAKGGIVISIKNELNIPVKLIGLGEKIDDLQSFNSADFVDALFGDDVLEQSARDKETDAAKTDEELTDSDTRVQEDENTDARDEEAGEEETQDISSSDEDDIKVSDLQSDENESAEDEDNNAEEEILTVQSVSDEEKEETVQEEAVSENDSLHTESEDQPAAESGEISMQSDEIQDQSPAEETEKNNTADEQTSDDEEQSVSEENEEEDEPKKKKSFFGNLFKKKKKK